MATKHDTKASGAALQRGDRRVCGYLDTGAGAIDANIAYPGEYADVDRALVAQNFLVVPGGESCLRDPPTEQHLP